MGSAIRDLYEAEQCYAPAFGTAKEPMNVAGKGAADVLGGGMSVIEWHAAKGAFLLVMLILMSLAVGTVILQFSVALAGRIQSVMKIITGIGLSAACIRRRARSWST